MSTFSNVLMRDSYNFGDLISFLSVHMPQIFMNFPHSNSGALFLDGTTVVLS